MNDDEARQEYQRIARRLAAAGLKWMIEELEEAASMGVPLQVTPEATEEHAFQAVRPIWPDGAQRLFGNNRKPRRRTSTRLRYRPHTPQERLAALRAAVETTFLDVDRMVAVLVDELHVAPASIVFSPDAPNHETDARELAGEEFTAEDVELDVKEKDLVSSFISRLDASNGR